MPAEVLGGAGWEAWAVAAALVGALGVYALLGGADFGGGVMDLLARGPRRDAQRALIASAIGPVWEANHVWLILAAVLLFSAFPAAFAALTTALHVPLTLFLLGVVARGAAFTFRAYWPPGAPARVAWGPLFSGASVLAPLTLGCMVGALASGAVGDGREGLSGAWHAPFALACGLFALALFSFLAACYLHAEAPAGPLREDFRARALGLAGAVALLAAAVLGLARGGAPEVWAGLTAGGPAFALQVATALAAAGAWAGLLLRRPRLARAAAAGQVALIVLGWAAAQAPYLVVPGHTVAGSAAHPDVLRVLLVALALGGLLLGPSLWALFRVFRPGTAAGGGGTHG
jgi:cytochrome d ubiquinol oxidase subunit II